MVGSRTGLYGLELTRFRGHIIVCVSKLSGEFGVTAQSITNRVDQAAIDEGKPLPGMEGLTTAEREELVRLRRQLRQVQMERDIHEVFRLVMANQANLEIIRK